MPEPQVYGASECRSGTNARGAPALTACWTLTDDPDALRLYIRILVAPQNNF
jgi:hypothetical protein